MGLVYPSLSVLVLHLSPPDRQGQASAGLSMSESLATALALSGAGAAFAARLPTGIGPTSAAGPAAYLTGLSVPMLAAVLAALAAGRLRPGSGRTTQ